jgi:hypothetical protein
LTVTVSLAHVLLVLTRWADALVTLQEADKTRCFDLLYLEREREIVHPIPGTNQACFHPA